MKKYFGRYETLDEILGQMTLEQKARLVIGASPFHTEAFPELGIPAMYMLDSCNGVNSMEEAAERVYGMVSAKADEEGRPLDREKNQTMGGLLIAMGALQKMAAEREKSGAAPVKNENTCYPPGIALGCSWDPEVIERVGSALAGEMASHGIDMILGPNVNIHRDPLCGRLGESFSEDPKLVSTLAPAMVRGIQKRGTIACVKHFAANNQEKDRLGVNEHVPERALREIYFPGFKACVKEGCRTVMSAYNALNGVPSAMNEWLLTDVLRKEWGFDGFVVSDWGASYDQVKSTAAGTDLTMPGPRGINCIINAVENGTLPKEKLDNAVRNILRVISGSTAAAKKYPAYDREESMAAIEAALRESIVLLQNDGTLPLSKGSKIAVYGKRSAKPALCPEGSSKVTTDITVSLLDGLRLVTENPDLALDDPHDDTEIFIVTVGADGREGADRDDLRIDKDDAAALEKAIQDSSERGGKVVVVVNATGPVDLLPYLDRVSAVLCPFFSGSLGGKVIAEAIFGHFSPSGKLPLTWPKHLYDTPAYKSFGGENKEVWYGEGIYVGYRWYDARHIAPLYPFGYGLSYTTFRITDVSAPDEVRIGKEDLKVRVSVKNTGSTAGSEVVQVYVHPWHSSIDRPEKELKGFCRVFLKPGEEKEVMIGLGIDDFSAYHTTSGTWIAEPGHYDLLIGTSSADIAVRQTVKVRCRNPFGLSENSPIGSIAADPEAVKSINAIIGGDILSLTAVALQYAPDKTIGELWRGTNIQNALKEKGWNEEQIREKYQAMLEAFDRIEGDRV